MTGWRGGEHGLHTWQHGPAGITELWGNVTRCSAARSDHLGFDIISQQLSTSHPHLPTLAVLPTYHSG